MQLNHIASKHAPGMMLALVIAMSNIAVAEAQDSNTTLDRVRETGELRIGYRTDAAPFSYRDDAGKPSGFSVDVCSKVADAIQSAAGTTRINVEFVVVADDRLQELTNGKVDMLCAGDTVTLSRRESVSFSIPVFFSGTGALLRTDAHAGLRALLAGEEQKYRPRWRASYEQVLQDRTFAVRGGSNAEDWAVDEFNQFKVRATFVPVQTNDEGVDLVVNRKADALIGERAILLVAAAQSDAAEDLYVVPRLFTYESIAIALPRGDEDLRLLVDRTVSKLFRSEEGAEIYKAHFGELDDIAHMLFSRAALSE